MKEPLRILRLALSIGETNAAYVQFSLPLLDTHDITICTYFRSNITPPKQITLYEGDDSLKGFVRVLNTALADKEYDIIHAHTPHVGFLLLASTLLRSRKSSVLRLLLYIAPYLATNFETDCCSYRSSLVSNEWSAAARRVLTASLSCIDGWLVTDFAPLRTASI